MANGSSNSIETPIDDPIDNITLILTMLARLQAILRESTLSEADQTKFYKGYQGFLEGLLIHRPLTRNEVLITGKVMPVESEV